MLPTTLPELAIVRVLTEGGPYIAGDAISVAFATPTIGRLVAHVASGISPASESPHFVPETISVRVTHAAPPYALDAILTLSFVDPHVARIHPTSEPGVPEFTPPRLSVALESKRYIEDRAMDLTGSSALDDAAISRESIFAPTARAVDEVRLGRDAHNNVCIDGERACTSPVAHEDEDVRYANQRAMSSPPPTTPDLAQAEFACANERHRSLPSFLADVDLVADVEEIRGILPLAGALHEPEPSDVAPTTSAGRHATADDQRSPGDDERSIATSAFANANGVPIVLHWNSERVRRFVQVVDKLFTIDRLGWYRHAFAMRLLIPDEISCGDPVSDMEAMRHLVALRAAAVETLGRPLLAAFMPNFTVSPEWLDSIDSPAAARALAGLRDAIVPHVGDGVTPPNRGAGPATYGMVERRELLSQPASTVESILPIFIASHATSTALSDRLAEYRRTLIDVFGQTARSAEAVRLNQMAQPNHSLDDRLWQLVGTVGESFGGLAVA